jgi:hypothetical protein
MPVCIQTCGHQHDLFMGFPENSRESICELLFERKLIRNILQVGLFSLTLRSRKDIFLPIEYPPSSTQCALIPKGKPGCCCSDSLWTGLGIWYGEY